METLPPIPLPSEEIEKMWRRCLSGFRSSNFDFEQAARTALGILPQVARPLEGFEVTWNNEKQWYAPLTIFLDRLVSSSHPSHADAAQPVVDIDWSKGSWPEGMAALPPSTRLALWFIKAGADPWAVDEEGLDALDKAVRANARPLVHALLSHPNAPSLKQLQSRRIELWGNSLPWLHFLANYNANELVEDLIGRGFDPLQGDNRSWPALAWASSPATVETLLKHATPSVEQRQAVSLAWSQRESKNWNPGRFHASQLNQRLNELAPLDASTQNQVEVLRVMEEYLRASPVKGNNVFKSPVWGSDPTTELASWARENKGVAVQVKSGPARGLWEPWTASLWAAVRRPDASMSPVRRRFDAAAPAVEGMLSSLSESGRAKWLSTEIRPGLTRQGFLSVLFPRHDLPSAFASSMSEENWVALVVKSAANMGGKKPGNAWKERLDLLLYQNLRKVELGGCLELGSPVWGALAQLVDAGLGGLTLDQAQQVLEVATSHVCRVEGKPSSGHIEAFSVAMACMGKESDGWENKFSNATAQSYAKHQALQWPLLIRAMQTHPQEFVAPASCPLSAGLIRREPQTLAAWESFVEEGRLAASLPASSSPALRARRL